MWRDPALRPLSHQHQHGLALCVILSRSLQFDSSAEKVRELTAKALTAWDVEIRGHFEVEERELFPEVRAAIAEPELIDALLAEHRSIEAMIRELREEPSAETLSQLATELSAHIRSEERRLFEQVQRGLDSEQIAALGKRVGAALDQTCPVTKELPWEGR